MWRSRSAPEAFRWRTEVAAAAAMARDGWWWEAPGQTDKSIRRGILREMLAHRLGFGK